MSARRINAVSAELGATTRQAPPEIQLWNAGDNPTDYGVHVWNERSVREVLERYQERGNPLLIDVEHNGAQLADGEPAVTGGYARLELRAGAPWLVFDWSDYAREQIGSGQRRFLSPEYDVDKNTGEILALYRVSLVADPGTHRARMLATAKRGPMDLTVILAALRAAVAAEDPAVTKESITNLLAELEKTASDGDGDGDGAAAGDDAGASSTGDATQAGAEAADGGDDAGDDDDAKKKEAAKAKASAKAPAKAAAASTKASTSATTTESKAVAAAAAGAVKQIEDAQRDHLIATHGEKLEPSIRRWASAQPLKVVQSFLDAMPAQDTAKTRAKATRGDGASSGLTERELQQCKARGIDPAKYAANKARMTGG